MTAGNARVRTSWRLHTGYALHVGGRDEQQDRAGVFPDTYGRRCLVVLADGMGGHRGGALASSTAVEAMRQLWEEHGCQPADVAAFLEEGARRADEAVIQAGRSQGLEPRTTIVALVVMEDMAYWMHVGDSRLYYFRDGELLYRTRDHSLLEAMVKAGEIAPEEVATHPDQNVLLRSIGSEDDETLSVTQNDLAVCSGDGFILCSDGFWEVISEGDMATALDAPDLQGSLRAWVNTAGQRQGEGGDNVSAAGVRIERDTSDEPRPPDKRWLGGRRALLSALAGVALAVAGVAVYSGGWWLTDRDSGAADVASGGTDASGKTVREQEEGQKSASSKGYAAGNDAGGVGKKAEEDTQELAADGSQDDSSSDTAGGPDNPGDELKEPRESQDKSSPAGDSGEDTATDDSAPDGQKDKAPEGSGENQSESQSSEAATAEDTAEPQANTPGEAEGSVQ